MKGIKESIFTAVHLFHYIHVDNGQSSLAFTSYLYIYHFRRIAFGCFSLTSFVCCGQKFLLFEASSITAVKTGRSFQITP